MTIKYSKEQNINLERVYKKQAELMIATSASQ